VSVKVGVESKLPAGEEKTNSSSKGIDLPKRGHSVHVIETTTPVEKVKQSPF